MQIEEAMQPRQKLINLFLGLTTALVAIITDLSQNSYSQSVVRRSASRSGNRGLSLRVRNSLSAQSSATTSGNAKIYTEANIQIKAGSTVSTKVGGENGATSLFFEESGATRNFEATGLSTDAIYNLEDSTFMSSQIETLDPESDAPTNANASSELEQETTLDVTYKNSDMISTFQQAF